MLEPNGFRSTQPQPTDPVPNQGVPSLLTDEQAAQLIFDTAADVRERDWAKATEKLEMLRFAVCIDSSPISNPFIERALRTPVPPSGVSLVALAVANGADRTFVETLVSWGADPHGKVSGNLKRGKDTDLSLLHLAMANNHLHLVPLLLQVGVQANGLSGCGYDPLAYFCATHTGAYLEQESVARVFRELFESGASFASRNPSGVSTMELLAKRAPPALFEMCLSLEAQRAEEHAVSPFTAGELRRWALKALADSTPYGTRSLESLSKLMDHTAETGAEVEGAASTISDILRGSVIGDSTDVVLGLSRELPLLERLLQDISGHPTLFSADSVAAALNTKLSGPGLQPTILATCLEYVSVYHRTSSNLVALALQLGADPNAEIGSSAITLYGVEVTPNTLLDKALAFGDLKVADLLIAHGADVAELQRPDQLQRAISEQVATIVSEDVIFEWLLEPTFEGGLYPEEHPFIIAAAYPHLFAAGHGVDSIEDILLPRFQSLDRNLKIKIASQNPELAFLPALLPDGTNLKVEQIRRFLVNATQFDEEKGAKQSASSAATSLLALPYQELLLQCIKEARLPEARLLLMNDCPIPRAYFEGRNPAELTHDEVSAIRHRMIEQCEKLSTLLFDNKPLPNTCKELQSEWYPLKSRSWQAQQSLTGHHLVMTVLKAHGDLKDAILLATALKALQMRPAQQSSIDPHGRALAELLPKLLYRYPLHVITDVLRIVEFQVDDRRSATPILAEAFAAFHHPEAIEALRELSRSTHPLRDPQSIGVLTAAISSFTNFIVYGKQVSGTAIHVWRTIANITHGHRRYRFETKRQYGVTDEGKPRVELRSFFETFGAKRVPQISKGHPFHSAYLFHGRGYLRPGERETPAMRGLDDYGVVVRYRAGEVFFDPSIGYIFTRNSSLTFGRDLLPSPLYFVPVAGVMQNDGQPFLFNNDQGNQTPKVIPRQPSELLQEITNLTPEMLINSAYPIMEPLLYPTDADIRNAHHFSESPFLERFGIDLIAELLRKRERFEREYRKFLFDTDVNSAWRKDEKGGDLLVGAFNSPGFGKWLKRLRAQFDEARDEALLAGREFVPPHILECHNPDTLPISPYARIILTDEVLTILERLAKEGWPRAPQAQREARDESSPDEVDGELEEIEEQTEEIDEDSLNDEVSELEETGVYKLISLALQNQGELIVVANT